MNPLLLSAQLFFLGVVFLAACGVRLTRRAFPATPYVAIFLLFSVGTFVAVAAVALVLTKGKTIFLPALIPVSMVLWKLCVDGAAPGPRPLPAGLRGALVAHVAVLATLCALLWGLYADPTGTLAIRIPHPDLLHYGRTVDALIETGQESSTGYATEFAPGLEGVTPYHYFELWLAAILSMLASTTGTVALLIPTVALLGLLALSGAWALMEAGGILTSGKQGMAVIALFLPALVLTVDSPATLSWEGRHYGMLLGSLFASTKVPQIVWIAAASALAAIQSREILSASILLLMVAISTVVGPAALTASTILLLVGAWRGRSNDTSGQHLWMVGPIATAIATAALFVFLGGHNQTGAPAGAWVSLGMLTRVNIFATTLLRIPVVLPVCLCLVFLSWGGQGVVGTMARRIAEVAGALAVGGAFSLAILAPWGDANAWQLSSMPISAAAALGTLVGVPALFHKIGSRLARALFALALLVFAMGNIRDVFRVERGQAVVPYYRHYSNEYLQAIARLRLATPKGGFVVTPDEIGDWDLTKPVWEPGPGVYTLGSYIGVIPGIWTPVSLSLGEDVSQGQSTGLAPFGAFCRDQLPGQPALTEGECQRRFAVSRGLSFVIISPRAQVSEELGALVDYVVTDRATGERFVVLRR